MGNDTVELNSNQNRLETHLFPEDGNISVIFQNMTAINQTRNITTSNDTLSNGSNYGRDQDLANAEIAISATILAMTLFGNGVVLFVLLGRRTKLSRIQWFIIHLCLADLSVAFFNVLPQLAWDITYRFQGSNVSCKLVKYLQLLSMYGSSYVLVMTSLDRYISICYPLTSQIWPLRRVHIMVAIAWFLAAVFSIPQLVLFSLQEIAPGSKVYDCWETLSYGPEWHLQAYITWIFTSIYVIPFLLLTFAYARICYVVWVGMSARTNTEKRIYTSKHCATISHFPEPNGSNNPVKELRIHYRGPSKSKIKTIKLTLTVISCYFLCWGPFFFAQMLWLFQVVEGNATAVVIVVLLASLNSCVNPWIFLAFSWRKCTLRMRVMSRSSATYSDPDVRTRFTGSSGSTMDNDRRSMCTSVSDIDRKSLLSVKSGTHTRNVDGLLRVPNGRTQSRV